MARNGANQLFDNMQQNTHDISKFTYLKFGSINYLKILYLELHNYK